jgi:hypothetical protein
VRRPFSEIDREEVDWLMTDRVPFGMLTVFAGDPKTGKSLATIAMAAALSQGRSQPLTPPGIARDVVLMNAEDSPGRVVRPRLEAAGADLARVHFIEAARCSDDADRPVDLARDVERLAEAAAETHAGLIVIDPLDAYLPRGSTENSALRRILSPLKDAAERLHAAVILVKHLTKSRQATAKNRILGSIGLVGAARANFIFEADHGRRTMTNVGCNLADPLPLAYRIEDRGGAAALVWGAEVDERAEERPDPVAVWLSDVLKDGPMPQKEVVALGGPVGFSEDQLKRAKKKLGAMHRLVGGFGPGHHSEWFLPPDEAPTGRRALCVVRPPSIALPGPTKATGREIMVWRPSADPDGEAA